MLAGGLIDRGLCLGLLLAGQRLTDQRRGLRERLLLWLGDLRHLVDVVAELALDRAAELVQLRRERGGVKRRVLLALGHSSEQPAAVLGGGIGRVLLGDGVPALAGLQRRLGGI